MKIHLVMKLKMFLQDNWYGELHLRHEAQRLGLNALNMINPVTLDLGEYDEQHARIALELNDSFVEIVEK